MNDLFIELQPYIISIVAILLSYAGTRLNVFLNKKIDAEKMGQIKDIVKGAVMFVEQVAKVDVELVGTAKYNLAKEKALAIINERGLTVTATELDMLIERFVLGLKKGDTDEEVPKINE